MISRMILVKHTTYFAERLEASSAAEACTTERSALRVVKSQCNILDIHVDGRCTHLPPPALAEVLAGARTSCATPLPDASCIGMSRSGASVSPDLLPLLRVRFSFCRLLVLIGPASGKLPPVTTVALPPVSPSAPELMPVRRRRPCRLVVAQLYRGLWLHGCLWPPRKLVESPAPCWR